jgi:hypothetical protein
MSPIIHGTGLGLLITVGYPAALYESAIIGLFML